MIDCGQHIFISGVSGSGKSTLTRQVGDYFNRIVILDRIGEWKNEQDAEKVSGFKGFSENFRQCYKNDIFKIVVSFPAGMDAYDLRNESEQIFSLIYTIESQQKLGIAIILEEAWLYCTPYDIGAYLSECYLTGRHHKITMIANTQRPASVHKNVISQCSHIFVGQYFEARDALYFRQTLGDIPELKKHLPKFTFLWFRPSEKPILIKTNKKV